MVHLKQTEFLEELHEDLKGTDFPMNQQYAIIEWVDCTCVLKYDETKAKLTEMQVMVNMLGVFIINRLLNLKKEKNQLKVNFVRNKYCVLQNLNVMRTLGLITKVLYIFEVAKSYGYRFGQEK